MYNNLKTVVVWFVAKMEFHQVNKELFTVIKLAYPVDTHGESKIYLILKKFMSVYNGILLNLITHSAILSEKTFSPFHNLQLYIFWDKKYFKKFGKNKQLLAFISHKSS